MYAANKNDLTDEREYDNEDVAMENKMAAFN